MSHLDDCEGPAGAKCGLERPGGHVLHTDGEPAPALTSPGHGTSACTHTLTPVTACYSPINGTVRNEPVCH